MHSELILSKKENVKERAKKKKVSAMNKLLNSNRWPWGNQPECIRFVYRHEIPVAMENSSTHSGERSTFKCRNKKKGKIRSNTSGDSPWRELKRKSEELNELSGLAVYVCSLLLRIIHDVINFNRNNIVKPAFSLERIFSRNAMR